jgi:PAS domain S-box-containing protein
VVEHKSTLSFLSGGGEMGKLIRSMDWSQSPLGPPESWPQSLRTTLSLCLASNFPLCFIWGPERVQFYNDGYWPICAAKHPRSMGQDYKECWSSAWPVVGPGFERCAATGETTFVTDTRMFLDRNGFLEETFFTYSYSPIRDESGAIAGIFHPVTETTHLVLAERRMRMLRLLAEQTADATSVEQALELAAGSLAEHTLDVPFVLCYRVDPAGKEARLIGSTGIPPGTPASPERVDLAEDDGGWPFAEVYGSPRMVEIGDVVERLGRLGCGPYEESPKAAFVCPITLAGGECPSVILVVGVSPRRPLDAAYRGFYALLRDAVATAVSKAHSYAEEKRRAEALAEVDRAKTAFFSNVSHEFRTPLTLMLGPLEELLGRGDAGANAWGWDRLEVVYRNGLRLLKLVNALLDFSRIEAGRARAVFERVDLSAFTAELAGLFRSAIEGAGLRFRVACDPLAEPVFVDREMWEKILFNLLSNAFKFTFEGEIAVELRPGPDCVQLEVRDTGTGIPEAELAHVFERFHRVRGAVGRSFEGSGIGLALVKELVRMHGGTIDVASAPGEGSVFAVRIPTGSGHLPADQFGPAGTPGPAAVHAAAFVEEIRNWLPEGSRRRPAGDDGPPGGSAASSGGRPCILLADDNADMRDYVRSLLRGEFDVQAVPDGDEALAVARRSPPDLVLSDVMMPGLDGFGLLSALRSDAATRHIPVIMLSARAGDESRVEGLDAGADDYLVKPFSARELRARVRANLELARMRQETARREERERNADRTDAQARIFDTALSNTADFVYTFDLDGRFTYANRALLDLWQRSLDEVIGKDLFDLDYPRELATRIRRQIQQVIVTRAPVRDETPFTSHLGTRDYEHIFVPVIGPDGAVEAVAGSTRDITERKESEDAIAAARDEAEAANRMKDEFLATLSHELRTPLNAILGWARILRSGRVAAGDVEDGLAAIERNSTAQAQIIEDLLDISRIISGNFKLEVRRVDLPEIIDAAIAAVMPAATAKGIRIHKLLDSLAGPVSGDAARLQQVVWNLLSNAVKFTPRGGRVQLLLERVNSHVEVSIIDTGMGITPEFLPHVFDRFRQADSSTTRRHGGLGLGLAIVKQLVEMHGGTVRAKSPGEGRGATFTMTLPITVVHPEQPQHRPRPKAREGSDELCQDGALAGLRVLVLDDEPDARQLIDRVLSDCEAEVALASSVPEALALVERFGPEVILSDIGMPGQDGYDFIRQVRARRHSRELPAAALTAFARAEDRKQALLAGFQTHVAKPVDPDELVAVVASLAGRTGTT